MDFCVDEKIMNYIEPVPDKLPAMEQLRKDRFNIRQLNALITELEELAKNFGDGSDGIPNKYIADLFIRKLETSKSLQDDGSLPVEWWTLKDYDFQNLIRNLDRQSKGIINWKQLAVYIILLQSSLPTDKDLQSYQSAFYSLSADQSLLDKTNFANVTIISPLPSLSLGFCLV